jgi:hypothetical protein
MNMIGFGQFRHAPVSVTWKLNALILAPDTLWIPCSVERGRDMVLIDRQFYGRIMDIVFIAVPAIQGIED